MTDHVLRDISNGIFTLTLNRPDKKNALTRAMYAALADGINGAGREPDVRCVLIQAEGNPFTAGNDLSDFAAINAATADDESRLVNPLISALANAHAPSSPLSTGAPSASAQRCCCTATWCSCPTTRC
jgi:enoyl-CoA hydratase/carnithine racemase